MSAMPTSLIHSFEPETSHAAVAMENMSQDSFLSYVPDGGTEILWPGIAFDETTTQNLERIVREEIVPSGRFPEEAVALILWRLERARAAAAELREAEEKAARIHASFVAHVHDNSAQLDAQAERLQGELAELDEQMPVVADSFHGAMAEAGLSYDAEAAISPAIVEAAIAETAPDTDILAGRHGIVPVEQKDPSSVGGVLHRIFVGFVAPSVFGFLVAICLGTLIGLINLSDLGRPEKMPMLLAAWVFGSVLVLVLGETIVSGTKSLARKQEREIDPEEAVHRVPRLKGKWVIGSLFSILALAVGAELCVEAVGLMEIHHQRVLSMQRLSGATNLDTSAAALPFALFVLIGTIISVSYVLMKFSSTWNKAEELQREAWLLSRVHAWIEDRRRHADVQSAIRAAGQYEAKARRRSGIEAGLDAIEARREETAKLKTDEGLRNFVTAKWNAAIGEATKAQEAFDALFPTTQKSKDVRHA